MATYRISTERAQVEMSAATRRSVFVAVVAVLVGAVVGGRSILFAGKADRLWFSTVGFLAVVFVIFAARTVKRRLTDVYSSFELRIDGECLTRKQRNARTISLPCSQVSRIEEFQGKGFRICARDRIANIWVPSELDGYDQVKAELLRLPIELRPLQNFWLRAYGKTALLVALVAVQSLAINKFVTSTAAFLIAAWFFRVFYRYYGSFSLTGTGRQQLLLSLLLGITMLVRSLWLLRC